MPVNILFVGAGFTPARWLRSAGIAGGRKARPYRDDFGPSRARNNNAVYNSLFFDSRLKIFVDLLDAHPGQSEPLPRTAFPVIVRLVEHRGDGDHGVTHRGGYAQHL